MPAQHRVRAHRQPHSAQHFARQPVCVQQRRQQRPITGGEAHLLIARSAMAQQESMRNQAEYARQTAIAQARYQAEIDQAQQTAAQAGPLAAAQAQQSVLVERSLVAHKNAELRQAELVAEVVRPAQAEAERITTLARAQADATKLSTAAAEDRIALDQLVIQQLPELLRAAAQGLQGANLTVLDGAEGLNSVVASLAAQARTLLDTVRGGMGPVPATELAASVTAQRKPQ